MDDKDFELILKTGESFFVEFKEGVDKSLAKEIVAFSNSQGGRIFIGIKDNGEIKEIRITNNKIVVFNPGGLVKWLKPEEFGTISKTRNPIVASLLARTIFVEKLGTGINRIRKAMESTNSPAPEFKFYEHSFYTSLFDKTMIKGIGIESQETVEKTTQKILNLSRKELLTLLENKVGSKLVETVGSKLVENPLKIVLLILEDEKITKNRMSEILNISDTAVDKNILKLKFLGIIKRVGPAKGGHWEVIG
uniref:ATP-dependent DNA helicase n=1 Tax=Uncultured archaeon GZfos26G2 TaxID=3386331 RepID=Q64AR6_UNCAG|nr:conserved hypothetical protein [uncultured archaeon GZfos29E12]